MDLLAEITGIDFAILYGDKLPSVSVARRMYWAAKRETTRAEDIAYCLTGLFDVHMPLLYGEGTKAFIRLQEEILKISDDESLFAHSIPRGHIQVISSFSDLLARSPVCFSGWGHIGACQSEPRELLTASSISSSVVNEQGFESAAAVMSVQ
jgi:hypothetical protein